MLAIPSWYEERGFQQPAVTGVRPEAWRSSPEQDEAPAKLGWRSERVVGPNPFNDLGLGAKYQSSQAIAGSLRNIP